MRLLDNAVRKGLILGLTVTLAACGRGGDEPRALASLSDTAPQSETFGPGADYPQVLGDPYTVGGQVYTPADVLSYDTVGYASLDAGAGPGIVVAHKTLPMPSYVEITSLESGTTILARVTTRGPMDSSHLVGLSPDAAAQIGAREGEAVRVRRVNPLEQERAELRAGKSVATRLEVPKSLLAVLRQKLPSTGSASLRSPAAEAAKTAMARAQLPPAEPVGAVETFAVAASAPATPAADAPKNSGDLAKNFDRAFSSGQPEVNRSYPLPPLTGVSAAAPAPVRQPVAAAPRPVVVASRNAEAARFTLTGETTRAATPEPAVVREARAQPRSTANIVADTTGFVIQAAAFADRNNAERAASSLDGFVRKAGRFYRVRTGPYATRGQAEAALAKVRAAGYSDARVFTAG